MSIFRERVAPRDSKRHMHSDQSIATQSSGVFEIWETWVGLRCNGSHTLSFSKATPRVSDETHSSLTCGDVSLASRLTLTSTQPRLWLANRLPGWVCMVSRSSP